MNLIYTKEQLALAPSRFAVAAAVAPKGEMAVVDVSRFHAATKTLLVPRKPTPGRGVAPAKAQTADRLWTEMHLRATNYRGDAAAEMKWLQALQPRLSQGCSCKDHYGKYLASNPPALESADAYRRWTFDLHNAVNRRLNRPGIEWADAAREWAWDDDLHVGVGSPGLGDAVCGLYAACGLAEATGRHVVYHARWKGWLSVASHPSVTLIDRNDAGVDMAPRGRWKEQILHASSCKQWYCDNLAKGFGVEPFSPRPPTTTPVPRPDPSRIALLFPFSSQHKKDWGKFRGLAEQFQASGYTVVAATSSKHRDKLKAMFTDNSAELLIAKSANDVISTMLKATVIVANDSGPAHFGGMLGVQTTCVHAGGLPHDFLFDAMPSVRSVTAEQSLPRGHAYPSSLASIPVEAVEEMVSACGLAPSQ